MSTLHLTPDGGWATRMFVLVLQSQSPANTSFSPSLSPPLSLSLFLSCFRSFSLLYNVLIISCISHSASYSFILALCFLVRMLSSFTIVMIYAQKLISLSCCLLVFLFSFFFLFNPSRDFFLRKKD